MIKKIHYIWLGSELPAKNVLIVDEWNLLMPEFEYFVWNEVNAKKYDCRYLRQCLRKRAFAFAVDYLRLRIINEYGGFTLIPI
jgi:mannosyltransferase OCH1-like enzyme